jgi:hypothetical protein
MVRRLSLLASVVTVTVLVLASAAEATSRHKRLGHKPAPPNVKLPPEVEKVIEREFPTGKVTGFFLEEKGELEVMVSVPNSHPIEVVFVKKSGAKTWTLAGFEYPVPAASLTPRAEAAIHAKFSKAKIGEVEMVFGPNWGFRGYQVTIQEGTTLHEVFITAAGAFVKDPL